MFSIEGLTHEQVEMLDYMWTLKTIDEYEEWYALLDGPDQQMAELLQRMVFFAAADEVVEALPDYKDAKQVLKKFALQR